MDAYCQRGGLAWGKRSGLRWSVSLRGLYSNATWPFATLHVTADVLRIVVGFGPLSRGFTFARAEVESVILTHGWIVCLTSAGVSGWPTKFAEALTANGLGPDQINILAWDWHEAAYGSSSSASSRN